MKKLILVAAVALLGACGSDDDDSGGAGDSALLRGVQSGATVGLLQKLWVIWKQH